MNLNGLQRIAPPAWNSWRTALTFAQTAIPWFETLPSKPLQMISTTQPSMWPSTLKRPFEALNSPSTRPLTPISTTPVSGSLKP